MIGPIFRAGAILSLYVLGGHAWAGKLSCASNKVTNEYMCFPDDKVRSNGPVRVAPFYRGGPKGVDNTGFTARVHCESKVLELTDRKGVAFVRNVPTERVGRDFVEVLCEHKPTKADSKIPVN